MFASSSKRALISTIAVTDLPASAASISALTIGLSFEVRYSVCLMAMTEESEAAWRRNWTTTSKLSYGWWTRSEEHTSELQSLMRTSYADFCLKNKKKQG